jgi:hypothetical protein
MEMVPVVSSNLESIGYDEPSQVLQVKFKGTGKTYSYTGVTPAAHKGLMAARSKGSHFATTIRGKFDAKKLT